MKFLIILLFICLGSITVYGQIDIRPYEQVALDYFVNNVIPQNHTDFKYIVFQGNVESESSFSFPFCIKLKASNQPLKGKTTKINIPPNSILVGQDWFRKFFVSKKKQGLLEVYRYYPQGKNVAVACFIRTFSMTYFYMFIIDSSTKQVIDFCQMPFT